jgi:simple sugar transport system substrate-binding protein
MKKQIRFISREEILSEIHHIISEHGTRRAICIQAGGGIGKTRLLQEIHFRHQPNIPDVLPGGFKKHRVRIIYLSEFTSSEWDQQFILGVSNMAKELGVQFEHLDARFDIDRMAKNLETAIGKSPDVIYVSLGTDERLRPGFNKAIESGIKVLVHDNFLRHLDGIKTSVTQDYLDSSRLLAAEMVSNLGRQGKIVAVWQENETIQQHRRDILSLLLRSEAPSIEIINQKSVWSEELLMDTCQKTKQTLQKHPEVCAFWVAFDELAKGVVQALYDTNRLDVQVYSFDLNPSSLEMMLRLKEKSPWKATVAINPYEIGRLSVRLATLAAYGDEGLPDKITLPMELVTQQQLLDLAKRDIDFFDTWQPIDLGYTPLLEALQKRKLEAQLGLQILDIVDFDDHKFRIPQNLGSFIAESLDRATFKDYFQALLNVRRLEEQQSTPEQLASARADVNAIFARRFNQVSQNRRIVMLFDTTEKLEGSEVWDYLLSLCNALDNVVFILAGRTAKKIASRLRPTLGKGVRSIQLEPLDEKASLDYLLEKTLQIRNPISDEMSEKVCYLAQGRPILIDLAVEWLVRDIPLPWMSESLEEIKQRKRGKKQRLIEFEKALVSHIAITRRPLDWLWLVLAHIHPMDAPMIKAILRKDTINEAEEMVQAAKTYVFVKPLPENEIALHDEMERMIYKYVWPAVDQHGKRRRLYSTQTRDYMNAFAQNLIQQVQEIRQKEKDISAVGQRELDLFARRETLQNKLWVIQEQYLHHTFLVSNIEGVRTFVNLFDEADKASQHSFMELLLREAKEFIGAFEDPTEAYEIHIREAAYLIGTNRIREAKSILLELLDRYGSSNHRTVNVLTRLANCERRLANHGEAVKILQSAVAICEQEPELKLTYGGGIYNFLGVIHRQLGEWDDAERYYREAIDIVKETEDQRWLASAYTNLAYIIGLKSEYESALRLCQKALQIQERLNLTNDMGRTHNVLGIIYRGKEDYTRSIEHIEQAISIFSKLNIQEWLAIAYSERGTTRWYEDKLDQARADLMHALDLYRGTGSELELPIILHRLGHVAWEKKEFPEAEKYFKESAEISAQVSDYQQRVNSLEGLVELFYYQGEECHIKNEFARRDEWYRRAEAQAEAWTKEFDVPRVKFPLYTGSRLRILGNIAHDQKNYAVALQRYMDAYPYIAHRGGYSRYMLPKALDWLQERIDKLPPEIAIQWCEQLEKHWNEKGLVKDFREMLTTLDIARDNAETRKRASQSKVGD